MYYLAYSNIQQKHYAQGSEYTQILDIQPFCALMKCLYTCGTQVLKCHFTSWKKPKIPQVLKQVVKLSCFIWEYSNKTKSPVFRMV